MKNVLLLIAGVAAGAVFYLATRPVRTAPATRPIEDLAHTLEAAWADHHTVA